MALPHLKHFDSVFLSHPIADKQDADESFFPFIKRNKSLSSLKDISKIKND